MKISIDTKEDSHEELKNVIRMLQNLVGESQEVFTNQPGSLQEASSPMANIFGDTSNAAQESSNTEQASQESQAEQTQAQTETTDQSTEDLFAELFSEEEIKKMEDNSAKEEDEKEEELPKAKSKKYGIEFY